MGHIQNIDHPRQQTTVPLSFALINLKQTTTRLLIRPIRMQFRLSQVSRMVHVLHTSKTMSSKQGWGVRFKFIMWLPFQLSVTWRPTVGQHNTDTSDTLITNSRPTVVNRQCEVGQKQTLNTYILYILSIDRNSQQASVDRPVPKSIQLSCCSTVPFLSSNMAYK